jgi:chromosome segregation ATPase
MNRGDDDNLGIIPSFALDSDEVAERRLIHPERYEKPVRNNEESSIRATGGLWTMIVLLLITLAGGGFWVIQKVSMLQEQLAQSTGQLNETHEKLSTLDDQLATTGKKVSVTGNKMQDQVNDLETQLEKLKTQLTQLQKQTQSDVDKKLQPLVDVNQKIVNLSTLQEQLQKSTQEKLQALDSKIKSLNVDISAMQEQSANPPSTSSVTSADLTQIEQRLQAIDTFRQSVNASIIKMQSDINALYAKVEEPK